MNYNKDFSFSYALAENDLKEVIDLVEEISKLNRSYLREWYISISFSNGIKKTYDSIEDVRELRNPSI